MGKHKLTREERQKGFRAAVLSVQVKYNLDFNEAVQWLMRKVSPGGNWVAYRERRKIDQKEAGDQSLRPVRGDLGQG